MRKLYLARSIVKPVLRIHRRSLRLICDARFVLNRIQQNLSHGSLDVGNGQRGVVAIFMAVILSILLLVSTISSARLQLSEISQSSQVDRSEQAYYAAEAGIEEALLRLKNNPNGTLDQVFPEQVGTCASGTVRGAQAALLDTVGNWVHTPTINPDCGADEIGQLAWRNRQVYQSSSLLSGTQVKDESIQYDTSSLRRNTATNTVGADGKDVDGSDIFGHFQGLQYCWSVNKGTPSIELTVLSWPKDQLASITTEKIMVPSNNAFFQAGGTGSVQTGAYNSAYSYCLRYTVNDTNRRYVFRVKPIFTPAPAGNPGATPQNDYSVSYQASLLDSTLSPYPLYIPNDAVIIDVIGQSGDIRRRLVAKKRVNGQILGVFDYVLYSGDPVQPICKAGVSQTDVTYGGCLVVPADNSAPTSTPVAAGGTSTANYTGSSQTFVVPAGVTAINVDVQGAAGGTGSFAGGKGARVQARLSVTPGETLTLLIGGVGTNYDQKVYPQNTNLNLVNSLRKPGGYNGGGNGGVGYESGYSNTVYELGASGGGASEIRRGGTRLVVAGGGGGGSAFSAVGGAGGDPSGQNGGTAPNTGAGGGGGGTQGGGGAAGGGGSTAAQAGGLGQGGQGGDYATYGNNPGGGGGGGGGYYGGGGGGAAAAYAEGGGGGGGSSYAGAGAASVVYTTAYRSGSGTIIISY